MAYSIEELDEALAESVGPRVWQALQGPAFSRVMMMDRAAAERFWSQTPDDDNSRVMREARADLCTDGCFHPVGGFGDEEKEGEEP